MGLPSELPAQDAAQDIGLKQIKYTHFGDPRLVGGGELVTLQLYWFDQKLPITYRHDSRRCAWKLSTRYFLSLGDNKGEREFATWDELRAYWPEFIRTCPPEQVIKPRDA